MRTRMSVYARTLAPKLTRRKVPLYRRRFTTADNNNHQENRRRRRGKEGKRKSLSRSHDALLRISILKLSSHSAPASVGRCAITWYFTNRLRSWGRGGGAGQKRETIGPTRASTRCDTIANGALGRAATSNSSRLSAISLVRAAGYAFVQQTLYGRCATYAIVNASASLRTFPARDLRGHVSVCRAYSRRLCPHEISASRRRLLTRPAAIFL